MNFSVLELETLPDIAGARVVYGLPQNLSDKDVAKVIFHNQDQEGAEVGSLPPHLSQIAVVTLLSVRDERVHQHRWSVDDVGEDQLLSNLNRHLSNPQSGTTVVWDRNRDLKSLLIVRAMINAHQMGEFDPVNLHDLLSSPSRSCSRSDMAKRLNIGSVETLSDEQSWDQYHGSGIEHMAERCRINAVATGRIWLAYSASKGRISTGDHQELANLLTRYLAQDGTTAAA